MKNVTDSSHLINSRPTSVYVTTLCIMRWWRTGSIFSYTLESIGHKHVLNTELFESTDKAIATFFNHWSQTPHLDSFKTKLVPKPPITADTFIHHKDKHTDIHSHITDDYFVLKNIGEVMHLYTHGAMGQKADCHFKACICNLDYKATKHQRRA